MNESIENLEFRLAAAEQRAEQAEKLILDAKNAVANLNNWIHVSPLYVSINAVLGSLQEECKRAEQAEADCIVMLAEVKQLVEFMNVPQERWPKVITEPHPGSALLAKLEQLRKVEDIADKLMKNICAYCPLWYREDISICAKWCGMREKYELRQALAQAERGQDDV